MPESLFLKASSAASCTHTYIQCHDGERLCLYVVCKPCLSHSFQRHPVPRPAHNCKQYTQRNTHTLTHKHTTNYLSRSVSHPHHHALDPQPTLPGLPQGQYMNHPSHTKPRTAATDPQPSCLAMSSASLAAASSASVFSALLDRPAATCIHARTYTIK